MGRHAYLIMAHTEYKLLEYLLGSLDDERNDIYLHMDRKSTGYKREQFEKCLSKSHLIWIKPRDIRWGDYSIIACELAMLEAASKGNYEYYHLISGVDMPLMSPNQIHNLIDGSGKEYVDYHLCGEYGDQFEYKVKYYTLFMGIVGRGVNMDKKAMFYFKLQQKFISWQENHGWDRRSKTDWEYVKGNQWFSISQEAVDYLLSQKRRIRRLFSYINGPDEFMVPTLLYNSYLKERIDKNSLRLIDWNRGEPYEFKETDEAELEQSKKCFVRKVSYERNPKLIEWLYDRICSKKGKV